ncbi:uncharacterized protein LOC129592645 isoform X2 [Paramacrobiotus metropolitanus]|nr:uncharacterized protein LOC129592645 isoform X2 [Paramacrobiotus metropolitanus]XP_055344697.1 uncharacterized protein LOC129592645 isoform X2 [Paramacrobiotus metropolitanus]XP_055344698.1 uncharacterized protein LOC129592645 isoform X2 [Paramacrobiotus metropolitanus]XP_055344700.1 uncharacterized protein LOC129592645 isoform X2 [Paramacrobiotus metropolitanus]XP_055344701.1 uncharacterized protein LOC129592645 isoform X2 [Paramacrobiotus metropolitanus]XP_055344702.1 uncharacterized prot
MYPVFPSSPTGLPPTQYNMDDFPGARKSVIVHAGAARDAFPFQSHSARNFDGLKPVPRTFDGYLPQSPQESCNPAPVFKHPLPVPPVTFHKQYNASVRKRAMINHVEEPSKSPAASNLPKRIPSHAATVPETALSRNGYLQNIKHIECIKQHPHLYPLLYNKPVPRGKCPRSAFSFRRTEKKTVPKKRNAPKKLSDGEEAKDDDDSVIIIGATHHTTPNNFLPNQWIGYKELWSNLSKVIQQQYSTVFRGQASNQSNEDKRFLERQNGQNSSLLNRLNDVHRGKMPADPQIFPGKSTGNINAIPLKHDAAISSRFSQVSVIRRSQPVLMRDTVYRVANPVTAPQSQEGQAAPSETCNHRVESPSVRTNTVGETCGKDQFHVSALVEDWMEAHVYQPGESEKSPLPATDTADEIRASPNDNAAMAAALFVAESRNRRLLSDDFLSNPSRQFSVEDRLDEEGGQKLSGSASDNDETFVNPAHVNADPRDVPDDLDPVDREETLRDDLEYSPETCPSPEPTTAVVALKDLCYYVTPASPELWLKSRKRVSFALDDCSWEKEESFEPLFKRTKQYLYRDALKFYPNSEFSPISPYVSSEIAHHLRQSFQEDVDYVRVKS